MDSVLYFVTHRPLNLFLVPIVSSSERGHVCDELEGWGGHEGEPRMVAATSGLSLPSYRYVVTENV
jgi:hypothetical protein